MPPNRARPRPVLETREFAPSRWTDFEELFKKYGGVQAGCWCMFYHRNGPTGSLQSAERQETNRVDHQRLLQDGHALGILVYREGSAVGWCQFGRREDLPRIERGRKYRALAEGLGRPPRWRITCFFVDRRYRRSGVARTALHAALEAIRKRGGGVVEAYPATHDRAVATWFGSLSMFEREGFRRVHEFGASNVLVRTTLRARRSPTGAPPKRPRPLVEPSSNATGDGTATVPRSGAPGRLPAAGPRR